jgi:hypothetical protein
MRARLAVLVPALLTAATGVWSTVDGPWWGLVPAGIALGAGVLVLVLGQITRSNSGMRTVALIADPRLLETKRHDITEELAVLENAQDLQRGVFEVSAELVGCVDEVDARNRFAAAMRRYWACDSAGPAIPPTWWCGSGVHGADSAHRPPARFRA